MPVPAVTPKHASASVSVCDGLSKSWVKCAQSLLKLKNMVEAVRVYNFSSLCDKAHKPETGKVVLDDMKHSMQTGHVSPFGQRSLKVHLF